MEQATRLVHGISHITAIISDQDKSLAWYCDVLGCEPRGDNEFTFGEHTMRWVSVAFPGTDLEIVLMPPVPNPDGSLPAIGDANMTMLAVSDCHAFVEQIRANGGECTDVEEAPWGLSAIVRDPDGNPYNAVQMAQPSADA